MTVQARKYQTSAERDAVITKMHSEGLSYRKIGAEVGMSANGILQALRRIKEGRSGRAPR